LISPKNSKVLVYFFKGSKNKNCC